MGITKEPVKLGPLALMLGLFVAACHRPASSDGALRQKLIGPWVWAIGTQGGGGATTLAADGSFVSISTNRWTGGSKQFSYEGTWKIKDGVLTLFPVVPADSVLPSLAKACLPGGCGGGRSLHGGKQRGAEVAAFSQVIEMKRP